MSTELIKLLKEKLYYDIDYNKIKTAVNLLDINMRNKIFINIFVKSIDSHAWFETKKEFDEGNKYFLKMKFKKPIINMVNDKLYIKLFDFVGILKDKYGDKLINILNNALYKAYKNDINNIVIDLTENGGGYQNSMLVGLQSLFDDNEILYETIDKKKKSKKNNIEIIW